ncbi:MAG TPA: DUF1569 domain-containing protein [Terriglobia bacterium]|nr:DUF1569 domain-containing protein [Terriglobia bacterium]
MPLLHDAGYRDSIKRRVQSVRPEAKPRWGSMTAAQMLWHAAGALEVCMGRLAAKERPPFPIPKPILRFMVLNLPWPKGAPTMRALTPTQEYDVEAERARCLRLIEEFAARPLNGDWPVHPILGVLTGEEYSRLQAKHLHHHLTQFGV